MKNTTTIHIGTSGWHYNHWFHIFYPPEIEGYDELTYYSQYFDTVENNSSFYRIAGESTYKTWSRKTPPNFKFSLKLNKLITHIHRLELNTESKERILYILSTTQVLKEKLGAIVIQLPASFKRDLPLLRRFLAFFTKEVKKLKHPPDIAIEFRNKYWFDDKVFELLRKYNVAVVAANSSRYPGTREITADIAYIRLHGPEKLFASKYTDEQLREWAVYIKEVAKKTRRIYVYFNNDFHGYALDNAKTLKKILSQKPASG
jgi:uncharacterized protein YecE (DUF72 family)